MVHKPLGKSDSFNYNKSQTSRGMKLVFLYDWTFIEATNLFRHFNCNLLQNIFGEVKNLSKIGEDQETLVSVFTKFVTASAKHSFM